MPSLELDRRKHAKRRVAALAVVEDLEVLEDRVGEFGAAAAVSPSQSGRPVPNWRSPASPSPGRM